MFNREIKSEKTLSIIYLFLAIPFISYTSSIGSFNYYYDYRPVDMSGIFALAVLFLSLSVRERYLQYAFQLVGTIQLTALVIKALLSSNYNNAFFLIYLLMACAAIGVSIKLFIEHKINIGIFFKVLFQRVQSSQHKIFGYAYVALSLLVALSSGLVAFSTQISGDSSTLIINQLLGGVAAIASSLVISEIIYYLIDKNWVELASIKVALDDTKINTYITRTLSSWTYLVTRHSFLIGAVVAVPYTLGAIGLDWLLLFGAVLLLPLYIVFAYLALMLVRLFFEYSNALIHIVQNTSK